MSVSLQDAWTADDARAFFRNVWSMYVHEISGFDTDFYRLDGSGHWQPDIVEHWICPVTPAANLREPRDAADPRQPFQRAHVIRSDGVAVGFICVAASPFRYMGEEADYIVAELFVRRESRGTGVAAEAVSLVLQRYPGCWHLRAIHDNARAIAFWRRVLRALSVRELSETRQDRDVVWTFSSPGLTRRPGGTSD